MAAVEEDTEVPGPRYSAKQRGRFTDAQVAGIEARVRHAQLPWWRRWLAPRPPTWGQTTRWD